MLGYMCRIANTSEGLRSVSLHRVDVLDTSTGCLLSQLLNAKLSTVCPVNKQHPRVDVIMPKCSLCHIAGSRN